MENLSKNVLWNCENNWGKVKAIIFYYFLFKAFKTTFKCLVLILNEINQIWAEIKYKQTSIDEISCRIRLVSKRA